jgi:hypothetical protein
MAFNRVTRVYPDVTAHQRINLAHLSKMSEDLANAGLIWSTDFDVMMQELIDIVCEHKLLQTVENERIQMEQQGISSLEGHISDLEDLRDED